MIEFFLNKIIAKKISTILSTCIDPTRVLLSVMVWELGLLIVNSILTGCPILLDLFQTRLMLIYYVLGASYDVSVCELDYQIISSGFDSYWVLFTSDLTPKYA